MRATTITTAALRQQARALTDGQLDAAHRRLTLAVMRALEDGGEVGGLLGRQHHIVTEEWSRRNTPRGAQGIR